MAQNIKVVLIDDIDGTDAAETVHFGLDGIEYEIDLSISNAEKIRSDFHQWISKGRKVTSSRRRRSSINSSSKKELKKIRDWASSNGYKISNRGRVSQKIRTAYNNSLTH